MDVLIVFGSQTDSATYEGIAKHLKTLGISFSVRVCSAHKSPENLEKLIEGTDAKVFIAGAGLSAALPGVVAAKTLKPVIGIPCFGAYDGLDSFLATHQMPPGIPVLAVGLNETKEAAENAKKILEPKEKISIVKFSNDTEVGKRANSASEFLSKEFGVNAEIMNFSALSGNEMESNSKTIFINFITLSAADDVEPRNLLFINVPIANPNTAAMAIELMNKAKKGLWVGLNRAENAAVAAVEVLNLHNDFSRQLKAYREKLRKAVSDSDATESKRLGLV